MTGGGNGDLERGVKAMVTDSRAYNRMHAKVRRERGRAAEHTCVECGAPGLDWAQIHDTDGTLVEHYQPMCRPCHMTYDRDQRDTPASRRARSISAALMRSPEARAKQAATITGHSVSAETRRRISEKLSGRTLGQEHREAIAEGVRRMHREGRGRWSAPAE